MKYIRDISLFESEGYIDYENIDLKKEFDEINTRMFDGKVKPVTLRWMNSKNTIGLTSYTDDRKDIRDVAISNYFKMTLQDFRNVLAHEMIHVYLEQQGIYEKDPHGPRFTRMRTDLNKRFPEYNIVKTENAADFEPSQHARVKQYGAAVISEKGDTVHSLVVFPAELVNNQAEVNNFKDYMQKNVLFRLRQPAKVVLCKSSYPDLAKFKIKKSLTPRSMEMYAISPEQAKAILDASETVLELPSK